MTFNGPVNPVTVSAATITISGGAFTATASNIAFNTAFTDVVITPAWEPV